MRKISSIVFQVYTNVFKESRANKESKKTNTRKRKDSAAPSGVLRGSMKESRVENKSQWESLRAHGRRSCGRAVSRPFDHVRHVLPRDAI